jgi:hypothetical protein
MLQKKDLSIHFAAIQFLSLMIPFMDSKHENSLMSCI